MYLPLRVAILSYFAFHTGLATISIGLDNECSSSLWERTDLTTYFLQGISYYLRY
jgi:hypothetical protein